MVIHQGAVYWVEADIVRHPHVVVQEDVLNHSRLSTVVVCALTSNLARVSVLGNVLLAAGEANLPQPSVVEVAKVTSIEKTQLGAYIGSLSPARVKQILDGLRFQQAASAGR